MVIFIIVASEAGKSKFFHWFSVQERYSVRKGFLLSIHEVFESSRFNAVLYHFQVCHGSVISGSEGGVIWSASVRDTCSIPHAVSSSCFLNLNCLLPVPARYSDSVCRWCGQCFANSRYVISQILSSEWVQLHSDQITWGDQYSKKAQI